MGDKIILKNKLYYIKGTHCGACKTTTPIVEQLMEEFSKANITILLAEDNMDICAKFGIMAVPSFLIVNDNEEVVFRHSGLLLKSTLIDRLDEFNVI